MSFCILELSSLRGNNSETYCLGKTGELKRTRRFLSVASMRPRRTSQTCSPDPFLILDAITSTFTLSFLSSNSARQILLRMFCATVFGSSKESKSCDMMSLRENNHLTNLASQEDLTP